jgi:hypothetical protein
MEKLNEDLNNGIVPPELDFSNRTESNIDWNKVLYNSFYRSYEFYEKRYAKEIAGIPGFDQVVRNIVETKEAEKIDPLTEYNNRISVLDEDTMHAEMVRIEKENMVSCMRYLLIRLSEQNIDGRIISDTVLQPTCGSEGER